MDLLTQGLIMLGAMALMLGFGVWIGLSLLGVASLGLMWFIDRPTGGATFTSMWGVSSSWTLTAMPMFILMGEILHRAKIAQNIFKGIAPWTTRLPGGMMNVNILGCAVFAAVTGSSAATVTTVGRITMPELRKRGYADSLSIATLAAAGSLGLLIPPSIILIVYGALVEESIAKLFLAGILPGITLSFLFVMYVVVWSWLNPSKTPEHEKWPGLWSAIKTSGNLIPVVFLIFSIMVTMYQGWVTATEAATIGVFAAMLLAALNRTLSVRNMYDSVLAAVRTTCMIMLILQGAAVLTLAMGYLGLPRELASFIAGLNMSPLVLMIVITGFYLVLGCFLDGISIIVLTMSIMQPIVTAAGIDLILFGIYLVLVVEVAQITPPIGFNLFLLKSLTGRGLGYVAKSTAPMVLVMLTMIVILMSFPELATYLPSQMKSAADF